MPLRPQPRRSTCLVEHTASQPSEGSGEIKAVGAGLKAFTESIGGVTGYFKGLPGLLTALIATPIVNASINAGLGK